MHLCKKSPPLQCASTVDCGSEVKFLHCAATVIPAKVSPVFDQLVIPSRNASHTTYDRKISASGGVFCFMYKKHFYISLIIAIAFVMGSYILIRANKNIDPVAYVSSAAVTAPTTKSVSEPTPSAVRQTQTKTPAGATTKVPETGPTPAPNVTFSVTGSSYTAFAPAGSTVIDAMRILASTTGFFFSGKDYPSLGFFVDSINGKKAESGHNWILYVNGKLSTTGASQTTLETGDTVEWRYEKNY